MNKQAIPFIGLVSKTGYVESYDYKTAEKFDFHHSYILSKKGMEVYHSDSTLRFVMYANSDVYTLEGSPALDPFGSGTEQIELFAKHAIEKGANPSTEIEIAKHYLSTEFEGKRIGTLKEWAEILE